MIIFFKKSTINWCESDYYYSKYIAEMYNTLTGICLCVSSILFYYNYKNVNTYKNVLVNLYPSLILLFIIGVGTFLFHGTLLYVFQLLDELPMLLLCIEYYRILTTILKYNSLNYKNKEKDALFNLQLIILQIFLCITIATLGFINDILQIVFFQLTIFIFVIIDCIKLYKVFVKHNMYYDNLRIKKIKAEEDFLYNYECLSKLINIKNNIIKFHNYNKELKYSLSIAVVTSVMSVIVWKYDQLQCNYNYSNIISGHAIWHILTSISLYYVNKMILIFYHCNCV